MTLNENELPSFDAIRDGMAAGKFNDASFHLRRWLERDAENAEACFLLAQIAWLSRDFNAALKLLATALRRRPGAVEFLLLESAIRMELSEEEKAVAGYRRVLALAPENVPAHLAMSRYFTSQALFSAARPHLEAAARLRPKDPEIMAMLGNVLFVLGHIDDAAEVFVQGLECAPSNVDLLLGMATVHWRRGEFENAMACYRQANAVSPKNPQVLSDLAAACLEACDPDEAIACCLESTDAAAEVFSHIVSALNYQSILTANEVAAAHREWGRRCLQGVPRMETPWKSGFFGRKPIRVGFVSGDFCQHPVGRFAAALISHLNPREFAPYAYDNGSRQDTLNGYLRRLVPNWREIAGLTDEAAARWIRDDQIHILVDLAGHTIRNRLSVFARQPAPVQVAVFAYPNTTGLQTVQYRITDPHADPPGLTEHFYSETLLRLPRTAWVYVAPSGAPEPGSSPVLANQPCVFGCLNNPMKISRTCLHLWSAVLQRVPMARLKLLTHDPGHERRLTKRFAEAGVAPDQLWLVPGADLATYFTYHQGVDLMFDPIPHNGGVSTCDALWMGVPVLTLAGDSYLSRQGVSILTNAGLVGCIAATREDFVEKAVRIAATPSVLAELRNNLRQKLEQSALMDYAEYARELGRIFVALIEQRRGV